MERYIGLDVHAKSSTYAVISESGKRLSSGVVETNGRALIEAIKTVSGRTHVCLEEGAQSEWLYEVLSPHVDRIVVTHLEESKRGRKDDLTDAFSRAEELRIGAVKPVFKDGGRMGQLRAHVDVQVQVTADVVRVQNRLKALYRSRGVAVTGARCTRSRIARSTWASCPRPTSHRGVCYTRSSTRCERSRSRPTSSSSSNRTSTRSRARWRLARGWDRYGLRSCLRWCSRRIGSAAHGSCGPTAASAS